MGVPRAVVVAGDAWVVGIDPGPDKGGIVVYNAAARRVVVDERIGNPARGGVCSWTDAPLNQIRRILRGLCAVPVPARRVVGVERFRSQGVINADIIRSIETYGAIVEIAQLYAGPVVPLYRADVLRHLDALGARGRDRVVRERMISEHGGTREAAVGRKSAPGPLYAVASHAWQALAVAYVAADRAGLLGPRP